MSFLGKDLEFNTGLAKRVFEEVEDLTLATFLLIDGTFLRGENSHFHGGLWPLYPKGYKDEYYRDFVKATHVVRLKPQAPGVSLTYSPTREQVRGIIKFTRKYRDIDFWIDVDFPGKPFKSIGVVNLTLEQLEILIKKHR